MRRNADERCFWWSQWWLESQHNCLISLSRENPGTRQYWSRRESLELYWWMLSENKTSCLAIPMEGATWDDSDILVLLHASGGFLSPCRDVPFAVGHGIHGAGAGGRRTIENVGFDHSYLNMKVKVLLVLPGLGAWGVNLYPVTVANGARSLCHWLAMGALLKHLRLTRVGTRAFHTAHSTKMGGRRSEGRRKMRRPGEIPGGGSSGQAMEQYSHKQAGNRATCVQSARNSSCPPRSGEAALSNDFTSMWETC